MTKKQPGTSRQAEEKKEKISQHKKSARVSSSTQKTHAAKNKNIQKTGPADDDWNDPTGNSHVSSSR
jgi:hypothetical protein